MTMSTRTAAAAVATAATLAALPGQVQAAGWSVTDLGSLGRTGSAAYDVRVGTGGVVYVTGWSPDAAGRDRGFRWDSTSRTMRELPPLPGQASSDAVAADAAGRVLGWSYGCQEWCSSRAVLWTVDGSVVTTHDLGPGRPEGLSPDGHVAVGYWEEQVDGAWTACAASWSLADGPVATRTCLPAQLLSAVDVNDTGTVVGRGDGAGVRLTSTGTGTLQPLPGHSSVTPTAVNASGVGTGWTSSDTVTRAVTWAPGSSAPTPLGTSNLTRNRPGSSQAWDVADNGWVVGEANGAAVLWYDPWSSIGLSSFLPPKSGWTLRVATGVTSDATHVVGHGVRNRQTRAFLMTRS